MGQKQRLIGPREGLALLGLAMLATGVALLWHVAAAMVLVGAVMLWLSVWPMLALARRPGGDDGTK
jgi:hypothetical protein